MDENEVMPAGAPETNEPSDPKFGKEHTVVQGFFDYVADIIVTSVVAAVFLLTLVVRTGYVDGTSMVPTMQDGDRYLVSELFYTPKQGDIVVFQPVSNELTRKYIHGENKLLVKRVIATEGQVVDINEETRQVIVDGVVLNEPYLTGNITTKRAGSPIEYPFEVPAGHIFVMGDNRTDSVDSRSIGSVDVRTLLGKIFVRFFPFNKIGAVD
jgi:signal peptidase I